MIPLTPTGNAILDQTSHRPFPLPSGSYRLRQYWHDLLFAHWPIPPEMLAALLPSGLEPDLFDGYAWVGVIPFWMDHVRTRILGDTTFSVPTTTAFPELNLRVYVRSKISGLSGVFFFSLDCASPLAVFGARTLFHLPYFLARMKRDLVGTNTEYSSRRLLSRQLVRYDASYRPTPGSNLLGTSLPGSFEYFISERYCLFTPSAGRMLVGFIHHLPWSLQPAQAEIRINEIPAAHGLTLPNRPPILHFSPGVDVFLWALRTDQPRR